MTTEIKIRGVKKTFAAFPALNGIDLDIAGGELIALLGPSGSGKTTLLRAIAGLETVTDGQIFFGDIDATRLTVQQRRVGFVFQHYALFKHMTVLDNIAFGLRVRTPRSDEGEIRQRVLQLLDLVQLSGLEKRFPAQLSGGQKQRVALARALAIEPRVLLLDEPFGALDARVRKDLRRWLRALHDKTGVTTVFVTHDQEEALELADRVVVMNRGRVEQAGTTDEVYEHPATPFVFDFLGDINILRGEVSGRSLRLGGTQITLETDGIRPSGPVDVYVRPHDLRLMDSGGLEARVDTVQRSGATILITARLLQGGEIVYAEVSHLHPIASKSKNGDVLHLQPARYEFFARETHEAVKTLQDVVPNAVPEHRERSR
ncbi:MAG: sulfate/molybdate ABC transporter ATP-binding protein [Pseudomonadota bacterium]